jgi:acyl-CoA dehydrogenase
VQRAESDGLPVDLWRETQSLGLTTIDVPEANGGSGGSLADAIAVHMASGRHAVPLPLAETYLAGWLMSSAGMPVGAAPATVAPGRTTDRIDIKDGAVTGVLHDVPWGRSVATIVALITAADGTVRVASLDAARAVVTPGTDYAGMPRDVLRFERAPAALADSPIDQARFVTRAGLVRSAQMAGAMSAVSAMTQRYTSERKQFGRPVGSFQAVQQHLVVLAQADAMSRLAIEQAVRAAMQRDAAFEAAVTKLVVSENAEMSIRAAHQAHGAIGMTQEYPLQQFTRRLLAWRAEFGHSQELARRIGLGAARVPSLAHLITSDHPSLETLSE